MLVVVILTSLGGATAAANRADPGEQLQHDLDTAIAAGVPSFAISPGVYRPHADLLLNNARDLRVETDDGGGKVVLLFTCNFGLVLRSCSNVSFRGVTIDYDPPCFSQGIVADSRNSLPPPGLLPCARSVA